MPDDLDGDLLARFVHGDRDAFERIFRQYEHEVYRWILRIVGERSAAEDALVEAFWRAYRSRARFDPCRRQPRTTHRGIYGHRSPAVSIADRPGRSSISAWPRRWRSRC